MNTNMTGYHKFNHKLYNIVNSPKVDSVFWNKSGNAIVFDLANFKRHFLDNNNDFCKSSKISSFIRQLNLYGFRKSSDTRSKGRKKNLHEFRNPWFLKGREDLLQNVSRNSVPIKNKGKIQKKGKRRGRKPKGRPKKSVSLCQSRIKREEEDNKLILKTVETSRRMSTKSQSENGALFDNLVYSIDKTRVVDPATYPKSTMSQGMEKKEGKLFIPDNFKENSPPLEKNNAGKKIMDSSKGRYTVPDNKHSVFNYSPTIKKKDVPIGSQPVTGKNQTEKMDFAIDSNKLPFVNKDCHNTARSIQPILVQSKNIPESQSSVKQNKAYTLISLPTLNERFKLLKQHANNSVTIKLPKETFKDGNMQLIKMPEKNNQDKNCITYAPPSQLGSRLIKPVEPAPNCNDWQDNINAEKMVNPNVRFDSSFLGNTEEYEELRDTYLRSQLTTRNQTCICPKFL